MNRFLLFLIFSVSVFADNKPHISSFSPQGAVKNVTQVKVHFSHPMTAFGNPRTKTDQFRVSCTA
ncbi:MAG TPA: hypothetical protein PKK94_10570, partial [Leptospiraceae bacterium]|nr:hypothetical protein [Leptospiraceae bacterium]